MNAEPDVGELLRSLVGHTAVSLTFYVLWPKNHLYLSKHGPGLTSSTHLSCAWRYNTHAEHARGDCAKLCQIQSIS